MILLLGAGKDPPILATAEAARSAGLPCVTFDQLAWREHAVDVGLGRDGVVRGTITIAGHAIDVTRFTGALVRLADPTEFVAPLHSDLSRCRRLHDELCAWLEIATCRVCNRAGPSGTNLSKPYQQQLIRDVGFVVPETLVTNDPEEVLRFAEVHGRVIYKSTSSVRSIVQELTAERLAQIDGVRTLPTQFQRLIEGIDVRVHVVGSETFATAIESRAVDYRYAGAAGAEMRPYALPVSIRERCLALSARLELPLCGIDLKRSASGEFACFEVNPAPAFTCFEDRTQQPIAAAVARFLAS